jgi:hypothetical protein
MRKSRKRASFRNRDFCRPVLGRNCRQTREVYCEDPWHSIGSGDRVLLSFRAKRSEIEKSLTVYERAISTVGYVSTPLDMTEIWQRRIESDRSAFDLYWLK